MKILVANLGSTSFKYRLFDLTQDRQLARGGHRSHRATPKFMFRGSGWGTPGDDEARSRPCNGDATVSRAASNRRRMLEVGRRTERHRIQSGIRWQVEWSTVGG
ncbi:MAG: hypothetical protein KatS3mg113_0238 [Planctomycetaceae bacterium]|nr:MAG: hypothetical protein KatS3mg113_0238 [Planctomycetaceae bacterium]